MIVKRVRGSGGPIYFQEENDFQRNYVANWNLPKKTSINAYYILILLHLESSFVYFCFQDA